MKKDNVEALKSSILVGVAFGAMMGGILFISDNPHYLCMGTLSLFMGFFVGLLTTWYPEDK